MKVSELNLKAKSLLECHFEDIELSGEISKITIHGSGHWYFDLKDEKSSIACVMFKGFNQFVSPKPQVGDMLDLRGYVSLYEASGKYQFIAKSMQKTSLGDLEAKFLALKEKLEKEGLFDKSTKKTINLYPKKVAIVTSLTSAALQDMLKLIKQKEYNFCKISIFDSLTQGLNAPISLINALQKADSCGFDVIVLARGGGSREDLFCFNDEELARKIYTLKTPVVSAIGHEIDYVISDFVADLRAPTPSAAIDMIFPSKMALEQKLDEIEMKFKFQISNFIKLQENNLAHLQDLVKAKSLESIFELKKQHLKMFKDQLHNFMKMKILSCQNQLKNFEELLKQHENFFQKSKNLINLQKDEKNISLKDLKQGDIVKLCSIDETKEAKIL
ncbi:exodeoxyribonuclease VII large subunit [Campylobacter volucris]|uniref:Exodeoxyribonuclease 7 large subunit n=1 Tax=Campylobacter volucris TaxID=1031542 RepID=A0AAE6CZQ4_9BACT|nr:exodeoxyribonuclease VII large subunit [Campylobacter volucris]AJC94628.1 exodeoxyribonuclease VII, large subunit [Campylobacter volucris LMG 24379]KAB0579476.1 exodeoxyribonuclease VII large subunit [Campylobacter volucris]QBL13027.1 exodeoxyribonuclease VII large subunit [Campylobacter volucris]QEL08845.1 exodeoxyribonuclease VII, large subunit [Campylobacter volucris]TDJ80937.1 exodeoxyribonuclease VII large subunit [Campylobacter volucris]